MDHHFIAVQQYYVAYPQVRYWMSRVIGVRPVSMHDPVAAVG